MGAFDDLVPQQQGSQSQQQPSQQANAFSDLIPKQQEPTPGAPGAFMSMVEGFNRAIGRTAEGVLQKVDQYTPDLPASVRTAATNTVREAVGLSPVEQAKTAKQSLYEVNQQGERNFAAAEEAHPVAANIGLLAGYAGQESILPVWRKDIATRVASYALGGGSLMAMAYGTDKERVERGLWGAAMSAALGGAGELAWKGIGKLLLRRGETPSAAAKILRPEASAEITMLNQLDEAGGTAAFAKRGFAGQNTNTPLSFAETAGSKPLRDAEAGLQITDPMRQEIGSFLSKRSANLRSRADKIISDFVPEGLEKAQAAKKELYGSLSDKMIRLDKFDELKANPVIANHLDDIKVNENLPASLKDLPDNNVIKLDEIKQSIDSKLYNNKTFIKGQERPMSGLERSTLMDARNQIVNTIEKEFPNYATARKTAERITLQKQVMDELSTIKPAPGAAKGEVTLDQMYSKLWDTPEKQANFIDAVKRTGGDTVQAESVMTVINQIRKSPLEKLANPLAGGPSVSGIKSAVEGRVSKFIKDLTVGRYNDALIKLSLRSGGKQTYQGSLAEISGRLSNQNIMKFKGILDQIKESKTWNKYERFIDGTAPQSVTDAFMPPPGDQLIYGTEQPPE